MTTAVSALPATVEAGISLSTAADLATAIGVILGIASVVVAFKTFDDARAADRRAHMHSLFGQYLTLLLERQEGQPGSEGANRTFMMLKLYSLEEMFEWVQTEKGLSRHRWFRLWRHNQKRLEYVSYWEATVLRHLRDDGARIATHMVEYAECYSKAFRDFSKQTGIVANREEVTPKL